MIGGPTPQRREKGQRCRGSCFLFGLRAWVPIHYPHLVPSAHWRACRDRRNGAGHATRSPRCAAVERSTDSAQADSNVFLHPVLRRYHRGVFAGEHHVLEDLLGAFDAASESGFVGARSNRTMSTYHQEEHHDPLRAFLSAELAPV